MSREWRLGSGAAHSGHVYVSQENAWLWSWHTSTVAAGASQGNLECVQQGLALQRGRLEASWNCSFHRHHTPGFPGCPERALSSADSDLGGSHLHLIFQVLTSFSPGHFLLIFSGYKGLQLLYLAMLVLKNEISIDLGVNWFSCLLMFRKF